MPGLDYKNAVMPTTGAFAQALNGMGSFYDGTPGRELVKCPDCGRNADALFGDHGGDCLAVATVTTPKSALGVLRRFALVTPRFSANDIRKDFDAAGVSPNARGSAFTEAVRRQWIEPDGNVPSLGPGTKAKRHRIQTYRSLIHPEAVAAQHAAAALIGEAR